MGRQKTPSGDAEGVVRGLVPAGRRRAGGRARGVVGREIREHRAEVEVRVGLLVPRRAAY